MGNEDYLKKLFEEAAADVTDQISREELRLLQLGKDEIEVPKELLEEEEDKEIDLDNLSAVLHELKFPQKLKLALLGNMTARTLLIRDKNRQIPLFVLSNPRLTENEVVEYSRNPNLADSVFRAIANDSVWMKNYSIKVNLISNAKTPIDIGLRWIPHLKDKDLRFIAKSKNVPSVVSTQCRKLIEKRDKKH